MKLNNYYVLSDLSFATVDNFDKVKIGDPITLNIENRIYHWRVVAFDKVNNFRKYQPRIDELIVFSNQQPDDFLILHK